MPPQELEASMYERLMEEMEKHGLHQYEISNFARAGFESRHNLTYWDNVEYYGIGAGAHGYTGGKRVANHGPVKKYITPLLSNELPVLEEHPVPLHERMEEEMFLGLRKTQGFHWKSSRINFCRNDGDFQETARRRISKGFA